MTDINAGPLDKIDHSILRELLNDGRISNQDLSERVGLSPSPCLRRVRRLEDTGVITGYTAQLDEEKIGLPVAVFLSIKLERQIDASLNSFEAEIIKFPEVVDCWLMTGDNDYLLRVLAKGLREYEHFLTGTLTKITGVASIRSSVSLRRVKAAGPGAVQPARASD